MVERLKGTLKTELEALKAGKPLEEGTPKKAAGATPKSTPRKRKGKDADVNGEPEASPTKRGRKKKAATPAVEEPMDDDEELKAEVKEEMKDEEDLAAET